MGATLAGLIVPALFLKRAPLPLLVLGGASIGLGLGVDAHLIKSFQEGKQVKPEGMVSEAGRGCCIDTLSRLESYQWSEATSRATAV